MTKNLFHRIQIKYLKYSKCFQPVFLIGCARSGTTILGKTLGKHKSIAYLNERKDLWYKAYPDFDIWSGKSLAPKLIANKSDDKEDQTLHLRNIFFEEQVAQGGDFLLEKSPINCFRLAFIESAFPNAKFIYLHRNGLEVAKSMEERANNKGWFGANSIRWNLMSQLLRGTDIRIKDFSYFEKGILEWRFAMEHTEAFFSGIDKERYYSLSYLDLIDNPAEQIANIYECLNLEFSKKFIAEITKDIKRKSETITELSAEYLEYGGSFLNPSIENKLHENR